MEIIKKVNGFIIEKKDIPAREATPLWKARPAGTMYTVWNEDMTEWNNFHDLDRATKFAQSF